MKTFATSFFSHFGAKALPSETDILVVLPPDLEQVFGKPRLYLTFANEDPAQPRELSPNEDLLVYGSRTFDRMLALLEGRGATTHLQLPIRQPTELDLRLPFANAKATLVEDDYQQSVEPFYVFHFRATYIWAEKEEVFITITLDGAGAQHPHRSELLGRGQVFGSPDESEARKIDAALLRQQFERAQKIAQAQVAERADALEEIIKTRLRQILARLKRFYGRLMAEITSDNPARNEAARADLEADLQRKQADELERHRLRIQLAPVGYAVMLVPFIEHRLSLSCGQQTSRLTLRRDLHTGWVETFSCQPEIESITDLAFSSFKDRFRAQGRFAELCAENALLCREDALHSVLAVAGTKVEAPDAPEQVCRDAQRYIWRRVEAARWVIYLGQRRGSKALSPVLGRLLVMLDQEGNVIKRRKVGAVSRLLGRVFKR